MTHCATSASLQSASNQVTPEILDVVRRDPTYTNHCRALEQLRARPRPSASGQTRLAVLSSFTVEPLLTCVQVQAALQGISLDLYSAPYNEYAQEILEPTRGLHHFGADVVLLLLTARSLVAELLAEPWQDAASCRRIVDEAVTELTGLLAALRARSPATVLVANLVADEPSPLGLLEWQQPTGIEPMLQRLNQCLAEWAQREERVYIVDVAGACNAFGRERAFDPRTRLLADQPFATAFLPRLAREMVRYVRAAASVPRKCLVLDLDNTLWGGILGEDGADRLRLGGDPVGEAYREFQRAVLALYQRGVLLALCSRNDEIEAMQVLSDHPGMLLRPEHFAARRINFEDKVVNLRALAADLNIGLDSLVFIDDDPFERQNVRDRLPEVCVVDLPADPVGYRRALVQLDAFDTLRVTAEDRVRGRMYLERRMREQVRAEARSLDEYLSGLQMEITAVAPVGATRTRLFQLVHKTNQFNLTTRRYGEAEFDAVLRAADSCVFGVHVRDRLGDSGVVGLIVLRMQDGICDIESFLLSCRVLGRSIESGVLSYATEVARQAGATHLRGRYVATAKNGIVRDLYARHGFRAAGGDGSAELWEAELQGFDVAVPPWARVRPSS